MYLIPVKPEEDEVSLVVKSGNLTTFKLWILRKQCSKHAADAVSQPSGEVVQNDLWVVFSWVFSSSLHRGKREPKHSTLIMDVMHATTNFTV